MSYLKIIGSRFLILLALGGAVGLGYFLAGRFHSAKELVDTQWKFISYNRMPEYSQKGYLTFDGLGGYRFGFCNTTRGEFDIDGRVIEASPGSQTTMVCTDSNDNDISMRMDDVFLQFIIRNPTFARKGKKLFLQNSVGDQFVFEFDKDLPRQDIKNSAWKLERYEKSWSKVNEHIPLVKLRFSNDQVFVDACSHLKSLYAIQKRPIEGPRELHAKDWQGDRKSCEKIIMDFEDKILENMAEGAVGITDDGKLIIGSVKTQDQFYFVRQ